MGGGEYEMEVVTLDITYKKNDFSRQVNMEVPFHPRYMTTCHSVISPDVSAYHSGCLFHGRNLKGGNS